MAHPLPPRSEAPCPLFPHVGVALEDLETLLAESGRPLAPRLLASSPTDAFCERRLREAEERLERVASGVGLSLECLGLTEVPRGLFAGTQLNVLAIHGLVDLSLRCNALERLPGEIGTLRRLERLDCGENALVAVPASLGLLTALRSLDLAQNRLTALPAEMGGLSRLVRLDLGRNALASLPSALGGLVALQDLTVTPNPFSGRDAVAGLVERSAVGIPALIAYLRACGELENGEYHEQQGASSGLADHIRLCFAAHAPAAAR